MSRGKGQCLALLLAVLTITACTLTERYSLLGVLLQQPQEEVAECLGGICRYHWDKVVLEVLLAQCTWVAGLCSRGCHGEHCTPTHPPHPQTLYGGSPVKHWYNTVPTLHKSARLSYLWPRSTSGAWGGDDPLCAAIHIYMTSLGVINPQIFIYQHIHITRTHIQTQQLFREVPLPYTAVSHRE